MQDLLLLLIANWKWGVFLLGVGFLLFLDLKVFHRKEHAINTRDALIWSLFWIGLSILFGLYVTFTQGTDVGLVWFTGYVIEKSLSVDNLFVFLVLLTFFKVPRHLHHKVLFWGIVGALVVRGIFIAAGTALISVFEPILFLMGGVLIVTAYKLFKDFVNEFRGVSEAKDIEKEGKDLTQGNRVLMWVEKRFPVTADFVGDKFSVVRDGRKMLTPLALVLIAVETTDVVFAMDSLPAVIAISRDPFIIFTSNVAAILGLRALFFLVENIIGKLPYLPLALAFALGFIGVKMLLPIVSLDIPIGFSVLVVLSVIAFAVAASFVLPPQKIFTKK